MKPNLNIGLLGGSFNPAHKGHLHISREAIKRLNLDKVWWLVSPQNPLKTSKDTIDFEERLNLIRGLLKNEKKIYESSLEKDLQSHFTIDSLIYIKKTFHRHKFVFIMGADNLAQLPYWERWHQIMKSLPIAVFNRPGYSHPALSGKAASYYKKYRVFRQVTNLINQKAPAWTFIWNYHDDISSTKIRNL
tara:strand:- start:4134 stop:4703 length:570 start_codon:yes stop_codon:yes gene_type:complete